ncbi:hypothetical protein D3C85_1629790 [compost metagenome]
MLPAFNNPFTLMMKVSKLDLPLALLITIKRSIEKTIVVNNKPINTATIGPPLYAVPG